MDAGILKEGKDSTESSSLGGSIKGITEQTGDLLASYINAIRADVSVIRQSMGNIAPSGGLLDLTLPFTVLTTQIAPQIAFLVQQSAQGNILAQAQIEIQTRIYERVQVISEHTAALSRIEEHARNTYDILHRVTPDGTSVKIK